MDSNLYMGLKALFLFITLIIISGGAFQLLCVGYSALDKNIQKSIEKSLKTLAKLVKYAIYLILAVVLGIFIISEIGALINELINFGNSFIVSFLLTIGITVIFNFLGFSSMIDRHNSDESLIVGMTLVMVSMTGILPYVLTRLISNMY